MPLIYYGDWSRHHRIHWPLLMIPLADRDLLLPEIKRSLCEIQVNTHATEVGIPSFTIQFRVVSAQSMQR